MSSRPDYPAISKALSGASLPAAFVDLDAFDANARAMIERAQGRQLRVATKSLRCVGLMRRLLSIPGYRGLMTYSGEETLWLSELGFDDLLVAYPCLEADVIPKLLAEIKKGKRIVLMVDHPEQLRFLQSIAERGGATLPVCLDIDVSSAWPGLHFGVNRSSIRSREDLDRMIERLRGCRSIRLVGVLGYEAQIAGVPSGSRLIQFLQGRSKPHVLGFRRECVERLQKAGFALELVNGGGTGSLEFTASDPSVTELAAGSGAYSPALFDGYAEFRHEPALGFALRVTRQPAPEIVTCFSGGYIASGTPGKDRLPKPVYPEGLSYLTHEAAGEVQTPLRCAGEVPALGSAALFRPAKAGETLERFMEVQLFQGGRAVGTEKTYRGEGKCFG